MNTGPMVSKRLADYWAGLLVARRKMLGLSQDQLAEISGVTQQAISQIERGEVLARDDSKILLARGLGTTPGELFPWPPMEQLLGAVS